MRHTILWSFVAAGLLNLGGVAAAAAGRLSPGQQQRVLSLLRQADRLEKDQDPVRAFLALREAGRLEQLWSGNTLGVDSPTAERLNRFTTSLLRRDDAALMKILHSRQVALADKLSLVKQLEEDVIVNYPGVHSGDELLQGYDE